MTLTTTQTATLIAAVLDYRIAEGTELHDEYAQELDDTIATMEDTDSFDPRIIVQWAFDYPEAASQFMTRLTAIRPSLK